MKDEYCSFCGAQHTSEEYPKTCSNCENITWSNPVPVVVCVQPVVRIRDKVETGVMIAQRAIEPYIGWWALIGGHLENGEDFEDAALREFREETGLEMGEGRRITGSYANGKGHVLVAVEASTPLDFDTIKGKVKLCHENKDWAVMWYEDMVDLCFPIHEWIMTEWWQRH